MAIKGGPWSSGLAGQAGVTWENKATIDFTAESNHDFLVDGLTTVIDGVTWTAANTGNADTFEFQNGTGLVVKAKTSAGRAWFEATVTAPVLYATVADIVGAYGLTDWLAFIGLRTSDLVGAGDRVAGISYSSTTPGTDRVDCFAGRNGVDTDFVQCRVRRDSANDFDGGGISGSTYYETIEIQRRGGGFLLGGSTSGSLPSSPSTLTFAGTGTGSRYIAPTGDPYYDSSTDRVYLYGWNFGLASATTTWTDLSVWHADMSGLR